MVCLGKLAAALLLAAPTVLMSPIRRGVLPRADSCSPGSGSGGNMWISNVTHGQAAFNPDPSGYQVFRNVMDFGCKGDGVADDTACLNQAVSAGTRCGENCGSATISPALVYVPPGKYLISSPVILYYFTQFVGDAGNPPQLIMSPNFKTSLGMLDVNPYIDGGNGAQWYINQNNFFRQIRNFVIDMTQAPDSQTTAGIHWQVAQATSLQNIQFKMSKNKGNSHQGIWMENGSGGFMSDLSFDGGKFGMWVGNQQFLSRNLTFTNCDTAIYLNWAWTWNLQDISVSNCNVGIDASQAQSGFTSSVGSVVLMDSTIKNTPIGVRINGTANPTNDTSDSILLDNIQSSGVTSLVANTDGSTILAGGNVDSWGRGSLYTDDSGKGKFNQGKLTAPTKSKALLDSNGNYFARSRPQYETYGPSDFVSVTDAGAKGDGKTDDTAAIQKAITNAGCKIVYFPHGTYLVSKTITVPSGTRITGELWPVLMANGDAFQDASNPQPMLQVGQSGETGTVEISGMMYATKGAQPGAILVEWNLAGSNPGDAGMWDSHFRVGGAAGSGLQTAQCPKGQQATATCNGAFMLLHLTNSSSAYLENVWAWTADHDLDSGETQGQISIYTGRGVLVESQKASWLYGVQSEHNVLYQYQLNNAQNVLMAMVQSETPYYQPGPKAPLPVKAVSAYNDPTFDDCDPSSNTCALAWSVRSLKSSNVYVYGAGLYNFFNNYDQTCLDTENCQDKLVDIETSTGVYLYNINTKASIAMVSAGNKTLALQADNTNNFCQTINAFIVPSS